MGQLFLKDRYGLTQGFEIAGDQPSPEEALWIKSVLSGEPAPSTKPPEDTHGIGDALGGGLGRGWNEMQAGLAGLGALAARNVSPSGKVGGYTADELDAIREKNKQEAGEYYAPEGSFTETEGAYNKTRYLAGQFGQSAPATIGGIIGAIGGSVLGPAGTVGGFVAGAGGAGLASLPQSYEQNLQEQERTHGEVKDYGKAFKGAVAQSALEGIADRATLGAAGLIGGAMPQIAKDIVKSATKGAFKKAAMTVGESTVTGMSTEAVTEVLQQAIQRWQADKPIGGPEAQQEYLESAIVGGLLGGATGGAFGTVGATLQAKEDAKFEMIRKDLEEQDQVGNNIAKNRKARREQAEAELLAEEEISLPNGPLLEDLRPEQDLLTGPEGAINRPASRVMTADKAGVAPTVPEAGSPVSSAGSRPQTFSEQEYTDAVTAMRGKGLVSPDKIKNTMKVGRTKAQAIFDAMLERTDARYSGNQGKYLTVVDKSTSGRVDFDTRSTSPEQQIVRRYEVRPIDEKDVAPYQVRRAADTKTIGPAFKTPEEAFSFADQNKVGDYTVVKNPTPASYGVYEVTSGVAGQKPTSRFVRSFASDAEARSHVNELNPALSPETNQVQRVNQRQKEIDTKAKEMMGRYQSNVQQLVDKMLGAGRTAVDLVETITAPNGMGIETGNFIEGKTSLANGLRRIEVAHGILNPNMSPDQFQEAINSVAHHEVLHVAKEAGLFTPGEWRSLVRRANTRVASKPYTYLERAQVRTAGAPDGATMEEEAVAEMVRDYMRDPTKFESAPRSLLRRLIDFIKTLGTYTNAVKNGNDVLRNFAEGKIGQRQERPDRAALYGTYYSSVQIPGFYLKSAKFFERVAEQNPDLAYPGEQWIGMMNPSKTGIKEEELQWLGLKDWLKGQKKVPVRTILQYIAANSVDVHEAVSSNWNDLNSRGDFTPVHAATTQAGGDDYTELVFHMPHLQPEFSVSAHFDGFPNILAFGRFKTRTIDGKKTLFIEEMQSDLHQQGKKKGYTSKSDLTKHKELLKEREEIAKLRYEFGDIAWSDMTAQEQDRWNDLTKQQKLIEEEIHELERVMEIPEAPFKTTWSDLVIKRLVRYAAENGHEAITWNAEPEGVALTEQYNRAGTDYSQQMEEIANEDGTSSYKVVVRDEYDGSEITDQDVTGIVNFYTKRLTKDIAKLFNKAEFGNPTPRIVPRVEGSGADLNLEEVFPTEDDFQMVMQELARQTTDKDWAKVYKKAIQIARNSRDFNPQDIIDKAGLGSRWIEDFNEAFPEYAIDNGPEMFDKAGNPNVARWMMDVTPELKATALGEGFPLFSSVQQRKAPDTPEFRQWFSGSKAVGDDGKPLTLYHGTLKDFDLFSSGRPDAAVGAGYYFTNNSDDASYNYAATNGPDQIYKMQQATDELLNSGEYEGEPDEDGILPEVRKQFQEHGGSVIPVYLSMQKPVVFDGANSTQLTAKDSGLMAYALMGMESDYLNLDSDTAIDELRYLIEKNPNAEAIWRNLKSNRGLMDVLDPHTGLEATHDVMRKMFEAAGYDGFIMKNAKRRWPLFEHVNEDTDHYIVFRPEQVKSVNNIGSYDPNDVRFMFSSVQAKYSATAPMGQRVPSQTPVDRVAEIEARITYNNIAPALEKLLRRTAGQIGLDDRAAEAIAEGTVFNLQDIMQPVGKLIDRIRANGGSISNESDTYLRQQLMTGQIEDRINKAKKDIYSPLINAVQKLNVTQADIDELLQRHPSNLATVNGQMVEKSAVRNILGNYEVPQMAMSELYLYAQHAKERNALMRERNVNVAPIRPDQYDSGSGMSDAEADDVLRWIGSKPFGRDMADLSNPNSIRSLYRKLIAHTNDVRVAGDLNPDFRTMRDANGDPVNRYQDYAPLRGYTDNNPDADELTNAFARIGKRFSIKGKEDKSALGRRSEAANLIAHAVLQNEEAIIRAAKNKVGQTFVNLLQANSGMMLPNGQNKGATPLADLAEIVPLSQPKPTFDRRSGLVRMANANVMNDPDIMVVKFRGKEVGVRIKDHRLRQAMLGHTMLGTDGQSALINGLLKVNRFLAAVRTSYNPEFLISNFFRDFGAANLNLTEYEIKGLRGEIAKSVLPAIRGVYRGIRDGKADPWRDAFEDFQKHGGKTAFYGTRDLETTINRVMDELSTDPGSAPQQAWNKMKAVGEWVEAQNDAVENGVRVATYKHLTDKLLEISNNPTDPREIERIKNRAAFAAKNLTVNFNMGGAKKPLMNALYLFFNASLQGSSALINPLIRSKTVRRIWLSAIAAGAMQDIIMSLISPLAPDGEKQYDKIPDQILETNMIFINPFSESGYMKIPMPYLFNAAYNSGRAMMRGIRGGYTPGETAGSIFGTAVESMNPWGSGGTFLNFVAPTVIDPAVDLVTNVNFMEAPIAPEKAPFSATDIPAQRYWNNTSPMYVTLANLLDKATGGDGIFKGAVSYSPNQYEYAFEWLGGGAWSTLVRAWDFLAPAGVGGGGNAVKLATGDEVAVNDIPFFRRFLGNLTTRENTQKYVENRDRVMTVREAMRAALKAGDSERYQEIMREYPNEYRMAARVNAFEQQRQKLSSAIRKINQNKKLTDAEKKKMIEPLKKQQDDIINKANLFMNEE